MKLHQQAAKRALDLAAAAVGLALLWPLLLAIAILVRSSSPGPMLFRHVRIGRGGATFEMLKLRTMYEAPEPGTPITVAGDPRVTPIGERLRRAKLDELPQLWNILRGDMSLVGPRPDVPGYADRLSGPATAILEVRPGLTGPATLYLREEEDLLASIDEDVLRYNDTVLYPTKVLINLDYLERWSLLIDIGYVLVTFLPLLDRWLHLIPTDDTVAALRSENEDYQA